jgi:3-dehydroquinate dehydratase
VSRVVACRQQMDRQTDMMKLIVAVHNFVNTPKTESEIVYVYKNRNVGVKLTAFVMKMRVGPTNPHFHKNTTGMMNLKICNEVWY